MAKYQKDFKGNYENFISFLIQDLKRQSMSATLEDRVDLCVNDVNVCTMVFERYSMTGKNRCSMTVTVINHQNNINCTAITSGGSQGVFLKINTIGEESFLDTIRTSIKHYLLKN
ncbi:MAG: DUF6054 family protein [Erysipelotrichaceae bacterium]|nr:DUF6054 family protein [Erysipelotrichaceae bacterium]